MSILIKTMNFPYDCYACPFSDVVGVRCQPNYFDFEKREDCPLLSVNSRHGRLIDADKLKQHYAWWGDVDASQECKERKGLFDTIVDLQPTVVEQEE